MARAEIPNQSSRFVLLASTCVLIAALYFAREVLIPLALAVLLSFLLAPVATRLERLGLGRVFSVLLVTALAFALLTVLGYLMYQQLADLTRQLPSYQGNIENKLRAVRGQWVQGGGLFDLFARGEQIIANTVATTAPAPEPIPVVRIAEENLSTLARFGAQIMSLVSPLGTAAIVVVFTIFTLFQRQDLRDRLIRLSGGRLSVTTRALDDAAERVSRYLVTQAIINGTYGLAVGLGLALIGYFLGGSIFPSFILWGILCALLRFIPYIGPWIAAAFPIILSLAVYPGAGVFLAVAAMFIVVELFSNNLMEPWLYGSTTGVSSLAILVAAVFWTSLWGAPGLFLSTPLTVCLIVLGKHVPQLRFLDTLLGDTPVFAPAERFYQRLLAMDGDEAADMVVDDLAKRPLEEVYDGMVVPGLEMAERDRHRGDLDESRQEFLHQTVREIIADVGERKDLPVEPASNTDALAASPAPSPSASVRVLCLPAHDQGDELAAMMLAQVLVKAGYLAQAMTIDALASEMIERAVAERPDVVCISSLPPSALVHSRYLCKRLIARAPEMKVLVGLWTNSMDPKKATDRLGMGDNVWLVTDFRSAMQQLRQIVQTPAGVQAP